MKRFFNLILVAVLILGFSGMAQAQSDDVDTQDMTLAINEIQVMEIVGSAITLTITAPAVAGDHPQGDSDNSTKVQYTSVTPTLTTASITASLSEPEPSGMYLRLTTTPPASCGTGMSNRDLTFPSAVTVIHSIPDCKTGSDLEHGAILSYSLHVNDVGPSNRSLSLDAGSTAMTVTFTLL